MKQFVLLVLVVTLFSACTTTTDCCAPVPGNLFPLQVGNYWIMKPKFGTDDSGTGHQVKKTIDTTIMISGREYFRMVNETGVPGNTANDTVYYRIDDRGYVFTIHPNKIQEGNEFRVFAEEGEEWIFDGGKMKMIKIEDYDHERSDIKSRKARHFTYDDPQMLNEEKSIVLGPEIGFLNIAGVWTNLETTEAFINGYKHELK
jgi:hypothetical protein